LPPVFSTKWMQAKPPLAGKDSHFFGLILSIKNTPLYSPFFLLVLKLVVLGLDIESLPLPSFRNRMVLLACWQHSRGELLIILTQDIPYTYLSSVMADETCHPDK
jgi:hypothetical protein